MNKTILKLAIPNIISNITVPLLGAVDLAMMGHLNCLTSVAAIALGAMVFNFMYWAMGFLRMGTCGFTAQAYGAKDKQEEILILFRSLFIALCGATLLLILQKPIIDAVFLWVKPESALAQATASYFYIRIWGAPAAIAAFAFSGWYIGMQNTQTPMWIAIAINIFNVIFNYLFVFVWHFTSDGVAIGTVLAQYAGLGLNIWVLHWKYKTLLPLFNIHLWLKKSAMKRFLNINRDIFFRTLLIIAVFSSFTAESTKQGPVILVLNTLLYQFFIFYSYAMDGFAHAAEALNGRFTGSGEGIQKIRSVKSIFQWGIVLSFAFVLAYLFGFNTILSLFTTDSQIISLAQPYLFWILGITILGFPAFLWDGVYAGSLATKPMLYIMLISTIAFFALYYSLLPYWGNHALWFALISFLLLRGLTMSIFAKRYIFIK